MNEIREFAADVNPAEIANQIERDNLSVWCKGWQMAINRAIDVEDERLKNALKEIIKLACESVEREKTLARLEAEVVARLEERHETD